MNKKNRNLMVIILAIAVLVLFLNGTFNRQPLSVGTSENGVLEIEIYEPSFFDLRSFVITPQSATIQAGQSKIFTDRQGLYDICFDQVRAFAQIFEPDGTLFGQAFADPFTQVMSGDHTYSVRVNTQTNSPNGEYRLTMRWYCGNVITGEEYGQDGYFGGNNQPNRATLTVTGSTGGGGGGGGGTQCTPGQDRCLSNMHYQECGSDGIWDNFGLVDGQCGYSEDIPEEDLLPNGASCSVSSQCQSNMCLNFQCSSGNDNGGGEEPFDAKILIYVGIALILFAVVQNNKRRKNGK